MCGNTYRHVVMRVPLEGHAHYNISCYAQGGKGHISNEGSVTVAASLTVALVYLLRGTFKSG